MMPIDSAQLWIITTVTTLIGTLLGGAFIYWLTTYRHDWMRKRLKMEDGVYANIRVMKAGGEIVRFDVNGYDFPEMIQNAINGLFGRNKPLKDIIKQQIRESINQRATADTSQILNNPIIKSKINKMVEEAILEAFDNEMKGEKK